MRARSASVRLGVGVRTARMDGGRVVRVVGWKEGGFSAD